MKRWIFLAELLLAPLAASPTTPVPANAWNFTVYLDDQPVGYHRFTLTGQPEQRQVHSEARFDVKFLLVTAYTYAHEAKESWRGDCLAELSAKTDDNGDKIEVKGEEAAGRFRLATNQKPAELPECVWTFAYWHPAMVEQKRLLNPQTGEYLPVRVELKGEEAIKAAGMVRKAKHYLLDAGKFQIDLWYGIDDQRWLALDSTLEGGRHLHYRME
jgi:hypothetical protein